MSRLFRHSCGRLLAAALLALTVAFMGCSSTTPSQSNASADAVLPPVVATVNGREIPTKLYEMYLKNGREALELDPGTEEGRRKLDQLREGIVSELIDRTLIAFEAERAGLSIPQEKLAQAEERAVREFGGDQKYDEYLKLHRLTRDEYREVIRMEVYGELMREELKKGLTISDEEVGKYYESHKADPDLQVQERVTASHVLIGARPNVISQQLQRDKNLSGEALKAAVGEEMERRRKVAEEVRRKAASGADFAALARQHSEDPSSRDRGGDLGTFTRDTHTRAFDEAAFALKPSAVSDVVQTDFGFHVIKVSKREPARGMTLAEAAPEIRGRILAEREAKKLTEWLKEIRRKAKVRINEPFRFGELKTEFPG